MKVSLNWMTEFVDLPTRDMGELKDALYSLGHEVEGVEELSADWTGVSIAEVLTVEPHPNADKVRLCTVTTGDEPIRVVCGAWNFEAGARVAFARPGAVLAGGFEIGSREIRGVMSHGMICSERELGLGEDHAGILVLDDDAPIGSDFGEWVALPDVVFDLSITPNRPDAMSVLGVARDLAAHFGLALRRPESPLRTVPGAPRVSVTVEDPTGCFRFATRELRGVRIGPSPFWLRHRLRISGMRPISTAVDVTNYVMLELGHPLHAFDVDRIAGHRLSVRRAEVGERLTTLDDVDRELGIEDLVICDAEGPTSLAGTMGGAASEVHAGSSDILLEAASWDPPTVMWMSRRHGLRSEASARFERGVDRELPPAALIRAASLLQAVAGGDVVEDAGDVVAVPFTRPVIPLTVSEVERVLGGGFDAAHITDLLTSIELEVTGDDPLAVTIPGFRPDIERPIDLVEEIARLHGYDRFGATVPTGHGGGWTVEQRNLRAIRSALIGIGLSQATHLSFLGGDDLDAMGFSSDHPARRIVEVRNPLREEEALLRTTLLPGLLRSARYNLSHGADSVGLFETGKVFFDRPDPVDPRVPDQPDRLGFVVVGAHGPRTLDERGRAADLFTATAIWRVIGRTVRVTAELRPAAPAGFHPGRAAGVVVDGEIVGWVGELHPSTARHYDLPGRVAVGEIDIAPIVARRPPPTLRTPSTFPPVEFDLAFACERQLSAAALVDATSGAAGPLLESARVFDEYGELGDGRKSVAVRYVLRASDHTLTNEEVSPVRRDMIEAAARLGAELRGGG
ncbi:MAG TPA: phenylalanine--tRNA ligase subunit beta [Acidimicrobiia bacterium]|nr:phenylalanine--tRNA ligase subunit beta [Acidimicrobiia bacterium]